MKPPGLLKVVAPLLARTPVSAVVRRSMEMAGRAKASDATAAARLAVCNTCAHRKPLSEDEGYCDQCGCTCTKKVSFASSKCPINKW